jgi:hypothetical protein
MLVRIRLAFIWGVFLAATAAVVVAPGRSRAAQPPSEFPYIAYVVAPDSYVRSGPGREHYPTGQLPAGYAVEVYRHDGAGWCAIRPPEGSFSLAPLHQLRMVDDHTAQVTADGVVARVGSLLGDQHAAVQVMLTRGETVALAERPSPTTPWVRIAPPAGEFRWIAARRLSRVPPTESAGLATNDSGWQSNAFTRGAPTAGAGRSGSPFASDDAELMGGDAFAHLRGKSSSAAPAPVAVAATAPANSLWQPGAAAAPAQAAVAPAGPGGDELQIIAGSPADVRQAQYQQAAGGAAATTAPASVLAAPALASGQATTSGAASGSSPRIRFEGLSAHGPLDPRVAEMQIRLSQIVIGAPTSWQFSALREETAAMLAGEQSPECREQLRDLLERIATFETVQARYRTQSAGGPGVASTAVAATNSAAAPGSALGTSDGSEVLARIRADLGRENGVTPTPGTAAGSAAAPATEALYDAVGTLKPVVSKRPNAPQFALIDDHGDVVTFVTAAPDVNLRAYVGQRIGVRGSRGFMPEYRRAHVVASRVTTLEGNLVK